MEEEECRICRSPAEPGRPLRRPCACSGTIRFVHDGCQLRWLQSRGLLRCEVCRREISTRPLYADAPPASELAARAARLLLLPLLHVALAVHVVRAFAVPLAALSAWRLALAGSCRLFSARLFGPSVILACSALWAEQALPAPAPARHGGGGLPRCQRVALQVIRISLWVLMGDMALAFIFAFIPFTLGRIILLCIDEVDCYASTSSIFLIGYGFMFLLGTTFAGMYTFHQYSRGQSLLIANLFRSLPDILFRGIMKLISVANITLNLINTAIICPLLFAWSLDICTSKIFGTTMSERFRHLFASSYGSTSLHWLIGCALWDIGSIFSRLSSMILRPGVAFHFSQQNVNVCEPFYKFYLKKLPGILVGNILIAMVILVPTQITGQLAPELFPIDITSFGCPTKGTSVWPALQNYADPICGVLLLRFLIGNTHTIIFLEWLVKKVMQYTVLTRCALGLSTSVTVLPNGPSGHDAGTGRSVTPKDKHSSTNVAKYERRSVAVHTILSVVLAWLTIVIFNSALLIFPISIGRASLFAITRFPLAGGLKSNDLLALVVGFGIISTIIAASRGTFNYITSGRTHLLASSRSVIVFLWFVIFPVLIGLLVDLSLISPSIGPDDGVPVLDLFHTWFLGWLLLNVWVKWVHWPLTPFLAYLTVKSRGPRLTRAKLDWPPGVIPLPWFLRDIFVPVVTRLLAALGVPYVLAQGVFPRFGYSAAANSAVYRLAWLGGFGFCVLCHLTKVMCIGLHDSIRGDPIGLRLEDVADDRLLWRTFTVPWYSTG